MPHVPPPGPSSSARERLALRVVECLAGTRGGTEAIRELLRAIVSETGVRSAALRLPDGNDYPFFLFQGLDDRLAKHERSLLTRDSEGAAGLACLCGAVLAGRRDHAPELHTPGGSFFARRLPEQAGLIDVRLLPAFRGHCVTAGISTLALIPLVHDGKTIGLLHLSDPRPDALALEDVEFLERLGVSIGGALERGRTEEALKQSEKRYRLIADNAGDVIWVLDLASGRFSYVSPSVERLRGFTVEEVLAQPLEQAMIPEHREMIAAELAHRLAAFAQGDRSQLVNVHRIDQPRKDGSIVPTEVVTTVLTDDQGRPVEILGVTRDISDRVAAEIKLAERERLYRSMFEGTLAVQMIVDPRTSGIVDANAAACAFYGFPREKLLTLRMEDLTIASPDRVRSAIDDILCRRQTSFDARHRLASGELRDVTIYSGPIELSGTTLLYSIIIDVTARKRAEDALRASEAKLRAVFEGSRDAIGVSVAGTLTMANPACARMFGFASPGELVGLSLLDFVAPESREIVRGYVRDRAEGKAAPTDYEIVGLRREGTRFDMDVHVSTYTLGGQLFTVVTLRDVTERNRIGRALQESRANLAALIESTTDLVWSVDLDFRLVTFNQAMAAYSMEQYGTAPRTGAATCEVLPPERASILVALYERALQDGAFRLELPANDGRVFDMAFSPVLRGSETIGVSVFAKDVTSSKRVETQLRENAAEIERRRQQLQDLASELTVTEQRERHRLASVLHDDLQQLIVGARFATARLKHLDANSELQKIAGEIDEILGQAINSSRSLTAELSPPVSLSAGLSPALEWLAGWMRGKFEMDVRFSIAPDAKPDSKDVTELIFRSVRELVINAAKHSWIKQVDVRVRRVGNELEVVVEDQGIGFDPARLDERKSAGSFGLFSIRQRLDGIGGRFLIESARGKGSRFTITVPLGEAPGPSSPLPGPAPVDRLAASSTAPLRERTLRVLITDDHVYMRQGLVQLLRDVPGVEVVGQAADGREAVTLAESLRPDVITMDIEMPVMDGIEATRLIRAKLPKVRIVGLSMAGDPARIAALREAGADAFLSKSGPTDEVIRAVLGSSRREGPAAC